MAERDPAEVTQAEPVWIPIEPHLMEDQETRAALRRVARRLLNIGNNGTAAQTLDAIRAEEVDLAGQHESKWAPSLALCINVLCDLRAQGWLLRVERGQIQALAPTMDGGAVHEDKQRIRTAHLVERDAQLRQPAVRKFIRSMERRRLHRGGWHSIFSLMRDGRALADQLTQVAQLPDRDRGAALRALIDPYVQEVEPSATCEFTGLALTDIWRYFRHTWTTTYQSTPGRKIFYLIRDRAAINHPVIGIGALGSAIVQVSDRDEWIGWTGPRLTERMKEAPTVDWAKWLDRSLRELIDGVMISDLLKEGQLRRSEIERPTEEVVARLVALSIEERRTHRLYPARGQHKKASTTRGEVDWRQQAETHLFRSKRAAALAELLEARRRLQVAGFTRPSVAQLRQALAAPAALRAIHTVLRRTKAAHVGVDMMDITVCGAVAPYSRLLGGKLVSLLMASPEVRESYNRRYRRASSVIASSMAGEPVRRTPRLVLLGTTSLYGVGASQYNRIRMPADAAGGLAGYQLEYVRLGKTAGYGSYHFSAETMDAIDPVLRRLQRGRPVNSIFGEGVNPKLRKVRSALDAVGLPADLLLQHGSPRLVYAVPLASNFRDVLIGRSRRPKYIFPDDPQVGKSIAGYWCDRWLSRRVERSDVIADVAAQSLVYPIQHGARVSLPEVREEVGPLFDADGELGFARLQLKSRVSDRSASEGDN